MRARSKQIRTVLFLGAGALKELGLPLTSELFPQIRERLHSNALFFPESNRKRAMAKMDRLREHVAKLFPSVFDDDVELPVITDVLSLIDLLLSTREVAIPRFSTTDMEDLRALLEEAIVETIQSRFEDPRQEHSLDRLTDWIINVRDVDGAPLTIVSTNYDTLIESVLIKKFKAMPEPVPQLCDLVDMGFSWREHSQGRFLEPVDHSPSAPVVRIYKLHGSESWLECPLCGFVYVNTVGGSIVTEAFAATIRPTLRVSAAIPLFEQSLSPHRWCARFATPTCSPSGGVRSKLSASLIGGSSPVTHCLLKTSLSEASFSGPTTAVETNQDHLRSG